MLIQVLGSGCAKCRQLEENARRAAEELNLDFRIEKVSSLQEIMSFGVMLTPALVLDREVKTAGKVPDVAEIKKMLQAST